MTIREQRMRQRWFCEACAAKGSVVIAQHVGAWEGMCVVLDAHRKKSPRCVGSVRVVAKQERVR